MLGAAQGGADAGGSVVARRSVQPIDHIRRALARKVPRSWRLSLALRADRVERRTGRRLSDDEYDRLAPGGSDPLVVRAAWLASGGRLRAGDKRIECDTSAGLDPARRRAA